MHAFESLLPNSLKRTFVQAMLISHDRFMVLSLVCKCGALKIVMVCPDITDKSKINLAEIEFFFRFDICVSSHSKDVVSCCCYVVFTSFV